MANVNNFSSSHLIERYPTNLSSPLNSSNSMAVKGILSGKSSLQNIHGSIIVDFTHEYMGLWSFEQPITVSGKIFYASYYYGLYNVYLSSQTNPSLKYFAPNGTLLIYLNVLMDSVIAAVYFYLKRRPDG